MNDLYLYWLLACGFAANLWLIGRAGRVMGTALFAAAVATSITRFSWRCAQVHGFRKQRLPAWMYVPRYWLTAFLCEFDGKSRTTSHFGGNGIWNGIGNWTVYPKEGGA